MLSHRLKAKKSRITVTTPVSMNRCGSPCRFRKKDLETGKALSGARFAVYEWNQEQQNYVPYAAWPELVTAINGEAVSGKLYYQKKNEGKFRLQETQPPKNYFGDYVDGEKEKGLKFYDFRITAQNAGQSLELTNNGKQTGFVNTPQMASIAVKKNRRGLNRSQRFGGGCDISL